MCLQTAISAISECMLALQYHQELSRIQTSLINDGKVKLTDGSVANLETAGGALALQIFMETIETRKETMSGLAKLGLKNENKLWTMLN